MRRVTVPVLVPDLLYSFFRSVRRAVAGPSGDFPPRNLLGDRDIEWSWVSANIPAGPGTALDFGNGGGPLGLVAALRGFDVTAVDTGPVNWNYQLPSLRFVQSDAARLSPAAAFDLVLNCSVIEHVGLAGRYGVEQSQTNGDLEMMSRLWEMMAPGGTMLLTLPVGTDAVFAPLCRVYGGERLPRLLARYMIDREVYWLKNDLNKWVAATKPDAMSFRASVLSTDPLRNIYGIGCFVLRKPGSGGARVTQVGDGPC